MSSDDSTADYSHSVTRFIERVKQEDPDAAGQIWQRYFERLIPLARSKLHCLPDKAVDAEDVLISVFDRFFRAAREGRFVRLQDRGDLWQILLMLTDRSVANQYRRAAAEKRGGTDSKRRTSEQFVPSVQLDDIADAEPDPAFVAAFNESLERATSRLAQQTTREVAVMRMEGYQNREVADRLGISLSSVERKLRLIRELWAEEFGVL